VFKPINWPQPEEKTTPISSPIFGVEEKANLIKVAESGWVGANGPFTMIAEKKLSEFFLTNALVVSNGSVALSLALRALNIGIGDEVLIPDLTYAATASAVINSGATPVFCDVSLDSWNISIDDILKKVTKNTKAIIVVHLYGLPSDMTSIIKVAKEYDLKVIEDCAEAFGATQDNKKVGTFASIGTFSFFPNKLITSGEGGLVVTNDDKLLDRIILLRGQGMSRTHRYYFLEPGFNFRMSDLQASVLEAQINKIEFLWLNREKSENIYREYLNDYVIESSARYSYKRSPWIFTFRIPGISPEAKISLSNKLAKFGIETRPVFYLLSQMPAFSKYAKSVSKNAEIISTEGISLPTGAHVLPDVQQQIIEQVMKVAKNARN
jgi:perosamine synthetase